MLDPLQKHWDNATLEYDLSRYNFRKWATDVIKEKFPTVQELEKIHEVPAPTETVALQQHVQNACSRKDFMEMFDAFVEEYIPSKIEHKRYMIQRQGTLRVVIPQQAKVGRRLHFHQGIFVGNGRGCRTIWTPLTKAEKSNTMWIMDLEKSRQYLEEQWDLEKFEDTCIRNSKPVELVPGQSHLFFQEHIHGNINNEEGYTRVSLDMRILLEGEEYGRRLPGGFMRMPGDHKAGEEFDYTGKHFITYAGWNSEFTKNIPLPMQRATMETYCKKYKIQYSSYEFESEHCDWQPGLAHYIKQRPDGIVLTSMYAMTDHTERRKELMELALENKVELHFANELCFLKNWHDLEQINDYLHFGVQEKGKQSLQIFAKNPKVTTITTQSNQHNQTEQVFDSLQQAKDWFYTNNAQKCSAEHCIRVEYALIADKHGRKTRLKRTEEWSLDGSAQTYNNRKIQLVNESDWSKNPYKHERSSDHLF